MYKTSSLTMNGASTYTNGHTNKKIKYTREYIHFLRSSPLSLVPVTLPDDLGQHLTARRERLSKSSPPFYPETMHTPNKSVQTNGFHSIALSQQARAVTNSRSCSIPSGMTPVNVMKVYRPVYSQEESMYLQVQQQLNKLTLDMPRCASPRPANHFHKRRTTPWNLQHPHTYIPGGNQVSPAPYVVNYGPVDEHFVPIFPSYF